MPKNRRRCFCFRLANTRTPVTPGTSAQMRRYLTVRVSVSQQHSVNIVKETFLALSALPSSSVLPSLANVITECGKLYRAELKPALEGECIVIF